MTTYSIYARPDDRGAADAIFLPDGFSWRAFVFTWIWALWNRMWIVAGLALSVMLIATMPAACAAISAVDRRQHSDGPARQ